MATFFSTTWSRPRGGDSFRIKWDRSLDDHRKTVLFYRSGYVQVLDEDVAMQQLETRAPTNERENISSSSLRDPFRARDRSWRSTRPIVGEIRGPPTLDLVEARVAMAEARAANAVPVRTAEGEAL